MEHCGALKQGAFERVTCKYKGDARFECDHCLGANLGKGTIDRPPGFLFQCLFLGCMVASDCRQDIQEHRNKPHYG